MDLFHIYLSQSCVFVSAPVCPGRTRNLAVVFLLLLRSPLFFDFSLVGTVSTQMVVFVDIRSCLGSCLLFLAVNCERPSKPGAFLRLLILVLIYGGGRVANPDSAFTFLVQARIRASLLFTKNINEN